MVGNKYMRDADSRPRLMQPSDASASERIRPRERTLKHGMCLSPVAN